MNKFNLTFRLVVFLALFLSKTTSGQNMHFALDPLFNKAFDPDSLKGFDEQAARAFAISSGSYGSEFIVKMFQLKTEYIRNKYNLSKPSTVTLDQYLAATRPAAIPGCINEDFEASTPAVITVSNQITGWVLSKGYNSNFLPTTGTQATVSAYYPNGISGTANSCNMAISCCPIPPVHSEIIDCSAPGGFIDPQIGSQYPIYSVFGSGPLNTAASAVNPQILGGMAGTKVLRLNDGVTLDYSIERLSKTFSVTPNNALFQFAFISVFAANHDCCDAPSFVIKLSNATANTVIPCPSFSVSAPNSQCTGGPGTPDYLVALSGITYTYNASSANGSTIYNPWKINSMDLTPYIGQNITIDIIVSDCAQGGHYGKIYFDAQCGPMTVFGNGNPYDAGTNVTVPTCGAAGATICAANGLGPYSWGGIGLTSNQSIPSMTNQCIVTNVSAQYTLYMQPAGSCVPIQRIVNATVTPAPLLNISTFQATCGSTIAIVTATPSGSAANPSTLLWTPTPLSLNSTTTSGTYTLPVGTNTTIVSVTASDPLGCKITATTNVNPAPPLPTFTVLNITNSNSITCDYPTINLDAASSYSYNGGSLNYYWSSANTTFSTNNVFITTAGNYTVLGFDPVTNCGITHTISISVNTIAPLSSISPSFQTITCGSLAAAPQNVTVTANPTVNVTHQILSPYGGTFAATSYSALYTPGGVGSFTYCLKNDINGCITCKEFTITSSQGFPTFNVTSPQNFTLGCNSMSCAPIHIDNGNTTLPQGGPVSYTILAPGASTVTPNGALGSATHYTVCSPGTYTVITKDNTSLCETRVPISVLQNTVPPNVGAIVERQILDCNNPMVVLKGLSSTSNIEYTWTFVGTPNTLQGDTITSVTKPLAPTTTLVNTYTLTVNDLGSTCKSTTVIPIYQNLYPPKAIISNGGTSSLTCLTNSAVLTNQSSTGIPGGSMFPSSLPVIGFLWEGPSPQVPQSNATTYLALTVGIYTLTAKDLNNGCITITTTPILDNRVYPDLSQSISTGTLDCGAAQTSIGVTLGNPGPGIKYEWSTPPGSVVGATNLQTISTKDPGEFSVLVTNTVNGCAKTGNFIVVNGSLTAEFEPEVLTGFAPLTINFVNLSSSTNGTTNINSVWSFGNGTTKTYSSAATASNLFTLPGTYTVTLYATKGSCMASKQKVIKLDIPSVLTIPNVFTPNNDGVNDIFFVKATNLAEITAVIFDRWGRKVYEVTSTTGNIEWDGKNQQGKESAEGTYFYNIKATGKDGPSYDKKGTINLYR